MNETIQKALQTDELIVITVTGGKTGQPRKFEIVLHRDGGKYYLAGQSLPQSCHYPTNRYS